MSKTTEQKEKIYDFDGAFDKRIGEYMQTKKGKFTQEQWEESIPKLYAQFAKTVITELGVSPEDYYDRMNEEEIASAVKIRLKKDVNIDGFLRTALEKEENKKLLFTLLNGTEKEARFALSVLGDDKACYLDYIKWLKKAENAEFQGEIIDVLSEHADELKEELLSLGKIDAVAEVLAHCKEPDERVFRLLLDLFSETEHCGTGAERLALYGDERAIQYIKARMEEETAYLDYRAMKYAVESLGGEVEEKDFSNHKDYIAIQEEEKKMQEERDKLLQK